MGIKRADPGEELCNENLSSSSLTALLTPHVCVWQGVGGEGGKIPKGVWRGQVPTPSNSL